MCRFSLVPVAVSLALCAARPARADDDRVKRQVASMTALAGVHGGMYLWTYFAWYRGRNIREHIELDDEGWFGPTTYAGGADKLGHGWANYTMVRGSIGLLEAGDWDRTTSIAVSAGLTAAFFTLVELKDGVHEGYGFSTGDMVFNLAGNALGVAMALSPRLDDMVDVRVEYLPTREFIDQVRDSGTNVAEDYSGMTFHGVFHLGALSAVRRSPRLGWARLADVTVGFRTRGYLPIPADPEQRREQRLFIGLSLDVQGVLREYVWGRSDDRREVSGRRFGDWASEVVAVPYTTLPLVGVERSRRPVDLTAAR